MANPEPIDQLQVEQSFNLRLAMDMTEEIMGQAVPLTNGGHLFCMSYHLRGVCNSNCGGRNAHRRLLPKDHGLLAAWKAQFCGSSPPPVIEVDAGLLSTQSRRYSGSRGGQGGSVNTNAYAQPLTPEGAGQEGGDTVVEEVDPSEN